MVWQSFLDITSLHFSPILRSDSNLKTIALFYMQILLLTVVLLCEKLMLSLRI